MSRKSATDPIIKNSINVAGTKRLKDDLHGDSLRTCDLDRLYDAIDNLNKSQDYWGYSYRRDYFPLGQKKKLAILFHRTE